MLTIMVALGRQPFNRLGGKIEVRRSSVFRSGCVSLFTEPAGEAAALPPPTPAGLLIFSRLFGAKASANRLKKTAGQLFCCGVDKASA